MRVLWKIKQNCTLYRAIYYSGCCSIRKVSAIIINLIKLYQVGIGVEEISCQVCIVTIGIIFSYP